MVERVKAKLRKRNSTGESGGKEQILSENDIGVMEVLGQDNPKLARIPNAIETLQLSPSACAYPTLQTARHIKISSDDEGESEFMAATKATSPKQMKIADKKDFDVELIELEKKRVDVEEHRLKGGRSTTTNR